MRSRLLAAAVVAFAAAGACDRNPPPAAPRTVTLVVGADSSIADVVRTHAEYFMGRMPGIRVDVVAAPSGALAERIRGGEAMDVVVTADRRWMALLVADGAVAADTVTPLGGNGLVLIVPATSEVFVRRPEDLLDDRLARIAVGNPERVASGGHARQALEDAGLWAPIEPRTALTDDETETLELARKGEVDAAIVFSSGAFALGDDVRTSLTWPIEGEIYEAAPLRRSAHPSSAQALAAVFAQSDFRNSLSHQGFHVD